MSYDAIYEKIARESTSTSSFQIDGGSATMNFLVDRANLGNIINDILGSVEPGNTQTGMLKRSLPLAHPQYDWLYATKINNITGIKLDGRELGETYNWFNPSQKYVYDFAKYEQYKFEVQFEPRPYLVMSDEDLKIQLEEKSWYYNAALANEAFFDPKEYLRFTDVEIKQNAEFLSSPSGQFAFRTQSTAAPHNQPVSNQNGGGINLLVNKEEVKFTWFFVPYQCSFSENVKSAFGKVNQYDFFGFPKGTLLMVGTEAKRYPPPVPSIYNDTSFGIETSQKVCDLSFICIALRQPAKDISTDIPASDAFKIKAGHNLLPRAGELKYYYVDSEFNNRPIYESYPFERMFRLT